MALFRNWISYNGSTYTGMETSSLVLDLSEVALPQVFVYFLFLFVMLVFLGAFLYGYGYHTGRELISGGSVLFIGFSILLIIGLGSIEGTKYEFAPWIAMLGGIIAKISLNIAREEEWEEETEVPEKTVENPEKNVCPSCGRKVNQNQKFCTHCGEEL